MFKWLVNWVFTALELSTRNCLDIPLQYPILICQQYYLKVGFWLRSAPDVVIYDVVLDLGEIWVYCLGYLAPKTSLNQ